MPRQRYRQNPLPLGMKCLRQSSLFGPEQPQPSGAAR